MRYELTLTLTLTLSLTFILALDLTLTLICTFEGAGSPLHPLPFQAKLCVDDWAAVLSKELGVDESVWHALRPMLGGAVEKETDQVNFRQQVRVVGLSLIRASIGRKENGLRL